MKRVIGILPGRFHPFHRGHTSSFKNLVDLFGIENSFVAISRKQELPESPFSAKDRFIMARLAGIPKENILLVKNPYSSQEYTKLLDLNANQTAIVFAVSEKDMEKGSSRFSFKPLKDGSESYYQPFPGNIEHLEPMSKHGYIMTSHTVTFPIAGRKLTDASKIRTLYATSPDKTRLKILADLYPGCEFIHELKAMFDSALDREELKEALITKIEALREELQARKNYLPGG